MLNELEIKAKQKELKNNILKGIVGGSDLSGVIQMNEDIFNKAVIDMKLEVYTDDSLNAFKSNIRKAAATGTTSVEVIEKAKKDLEGLQKVQIVKKGGNLTSVYVKKREEDESEKIDKGSKV